jgi:hypothetical protein
MSHGIAASYKSHRDNCSRFRSFDALAALVDSATVPRDVTITSDEPDGTITPRPAVTVPASGGAQSSFRYGMVLVPGCM